VKGDSGLKRDLARALGLGPREHVAIVGGGGKTSLLFSLAEELRGKGKRVVTATTTKIWRREAERSPCVIFFPSDSGFLERVGKALDRHGQVFLAECPLDSGKVKGLDPEVPDRLFRGVLADYVILEADGAAGRPVKAPAQHEPVVPSSATLVLALMGLEALGGTLEPEVVFRPALFEKLTGLPHGGRLGPEVLSKVFLEPEGLFKGAPLSARCVAFLNKADLLQSEAEAEALSRLILDAPGSAVERVVLGSILKGRYRVIGKDG
jgi:probable selenium-dependent hydroxylase accessory protein YqeC